MSALVGAVLAYAALATGNAGASGAAALCAASGAACESDAPSGSPEALATPAEVDCPGTTMVVSNGEALLLWGSCLTPVLDFRYRVSRIPENEINSGGVGPERPRRSHVRLASTSGVPSGHGDLTSRLTAQPMAMFAVPALRPDPQRRTVTLIDETARMRTLEPLDRPPRPRA